MPSVSPRNSPTPGAFPGASGQPFPRSGGPSLGSPEHNERSGVRIGDHGSIDGGWGSLARPKPLAWSWADGATVRVRLGFSGRPQSDFWALDLPEPTLITATRRCDDPAVVHLSVGLVTPTGRHLGSLAHGATPSGAVGAVPGGALGRPNQPVAAKQTSPLAGSGSSHETPFGGSVVLVCAMGLAVEIDAVVQLSFAPAGGRVSGSTRILAQLQRRN